MIVGVIPARLHSTRLPRKLLLDRTGKPVIQHTCEAASRCESLSRIVVATDSEEIANVVRSFGGECELTGEHPSGTDRIAEVAQRTLIDAEIIVNIQGDEPEIDPDSISTLITLLDDHPTAEMATLCTPITTSADVTDPARVKVVTSHDGRALYFSRAPIPHVRDSSIADVLSSSERSPYRLHLGIYAYRREFLLRMTEADPSPLEQLEKLEQLRALEMGATILVGEVSNHSAGIDTPEDYERFVLNQ